MKLNDNPTALIDWFDDFIGPNPYSFLSNFYEAEVAWEGERFPSSEHAFAWAKVPDYEPAWRRRIRDADGPGEAKALGRACPLRDDWETVKYGIMKSIVWAKFTQHADLRLGLLDTGSAYLQEGTFWGDRIWGVDLTVNPAIAPMDRPGNNWLGHILMHTRARLEAHL